MTHPLRPRMGQAWYGGNHEWYYRRAREMVHEASSTADSAQEEFSAVHWPRLHRELMRLWSERVLDTESRAARRSEAVAVESTDENEEYDYELDAEPYEYEVAEEPESPPPEKWQANVRAHLRVASVALEDCADQIQEGAYLELYDALQGIYDATR